MRGQKRPADERARAVGIAVLTSGSEAARQTGIPERTINQWLVSPEFAELRERTRDQVAEEWWSIVQFGFRRVRELLETEKDTQKAATATAIITDKMLVIRGEATSRYETRDLTGSFDDHELHTLRDLIDAGTTAEGEAGAAVANPGSSGADRP